MDVLKSKFMLVFLALIMVFAGATIAWFIGANRLENRLIALGAQGSNDALTLDCADQHISGYPFRYVATCEHPRISVAIDGIAPFEIVMSRLQRVSLVYRQNQHLFFAQGPLLLTDMENGSTKVLDASFDLMSLSTRSSDRGLERISVVMDKPKLMLNGQTVTQTASLARLEAHLVASNPSNNNVHQDYDLFVSGEGGDVEMPFTLRVQAKDFVTKPEDFSDRTFVARQLQQGITLDARLVSNAVQSVDFAAPDYQGLIALSAQSGLWGLLEAQDKSKPAAARFFRDLAVLANGTQIDISGLFKLSQP